MPYVDMFVAAIAPDKKDEFAVHAKVAHDVIMDCGALSIMDAWDDDVPEGELTSFRKAVNATKEEVITAGWIIWPDRDTRNAGFEKMMADPRMQPDRNPMPFDGKRMIFGGFTPLVETP